MAIIHKREKEKEKGLTAKREKEGNAFSILLNSKKDTN